MQILHDFFLRNFNLDYLILVCYNKNMAEKKSNGFRTFLLILTTIILAGVFGFAAYLILVPNSSLFGLRYLSNSDNILIEDIKNGTSTIPLDFSDYSKIVVNANGGKGHTHVQVNYDNPTGIVNSQIRLLEDTKGFTRVGYAVDYTLSAVKNGSTLEITVTEPEYNFLQLANQTVLQLNVHEHDSISGATIEINTGSGCVTLGGKSTTTGFALDTTTGNVDVTTTSGAILLTENLTVTSSASFVSQTGIIEIPGIVDDDTSNNRAIPSIYLESNTGKIQTADLSGNISLKSYNSKITLGNIVGSVDVDMESGILNLQNINGNLISENHLLYTTVKAGTISGDVTLVNDDGNFAVDIKAVKGDVAVRGGNKGVKLGAVYSTCTVQTINGVVDVTKVDSNTSELLITTTGGGAVYLNTAKVLPDGSLTIENSKLLGNNKVTTLNGSIVLRFGSASEFNLKAQSENGRVYRTWLDSNQNPVDDAVGAENSGNNVELTTTNGQIRVERI